MINWTCLLLLPVIYLQSSSCSIYQIIDGTLTRPWTFNLTMFIHELRGVMLHCVDSQSTQIRMEIVINKQRNLGKMVRLTFNTISKEVSLKQLCGCDPCDGTRMYLQFRLDNTTINTRCNNEKEVFISTVEGTMTQGGIDIQNIVYPVPMEIVNLTNKIFIMIGNVGPYAVDNGVKINPLKEQMIGCVDQFFYNDKITKFIGNISKMRPSCPCIDNLCNGGKCKESMDMAHICDCHSTPLNGPFCNKSLTVYNRGGNYSYEKIKNAKEIYLKMTWKTMLDKEYCLVEIVREYGHVTLWTNKSRVMIDSFAVSDFDVDGINFVNVTIVNNNLIVTTKRGESKTNFTINDLTRINVGFSANITRCDILEGAFDIDFDSSQLRLIQPGQNYLINITKTTGYTFTWDMKYVLFTAVLIGCITVLIIFMILLHQRSKKQLDTQIQKFKAQSIQELDNQSHIFTECGVYGKVDDNCMYEYIEDTDVYATINV